VKRNLDLIRQMMLALEEDPDLNGRSRLNGFASQLVPLPDYDEDTLAYNLMMILDEGWLDGEYGMTSGTFTVTRLTADGHDFIDSTRSPDVWDKAKSIATSAGGDTLRFVLETAKGVIRAEIARKLGLFTP
jgi:hypothetical protein